MYQQGAGSGLNGGYPPGIPSSSGLRAPGSARATWFTIAMICHTMTATNDGFEWNGQFFKSLSAIARHITGRNWNGYTFFGIKRASPGNKNAAGSRGKRGVPP